MAAYDMIQRFRLDGKVSLVTGGSRGLGRAMAEALAGAGSDVVITGRDQSTLDPVAEEIRRHTGRRVLALQMDISDIASLPAKVARIVEEFGRIDVLVNNAGINIRQPALDYTEEAWDAVTGVNVKGTFFLTQEVGKVMMKQRRGKIINILSLTVAWGLPTVVAYTAAKAGLMGLTRLLAVEWAEYNIQVNAIAPGFFRTEMTRPVREDQRNEWILHRVPMRRWGEPEELTGACIFLASPASDYITGQIFWVDGGITAGSDWRTGL